MQPSVGEQMGSGGNISLGLLSLSVDMMATVNIVLDLYLEQKPMRGGVGGVAQVEKKRK